MENKQKKWYEYNEKDRIQNVFGKYTIQQFWDFWSNKEHHYMEVRIKNVPLIKEISFKLQIPYSMSGVYVKNATELKDVIIFARNKAVMWFSINPRKKNWSKKLNFKTFGSGKKGGSSDENVESINFIFVDIDRVKKEGPALIDDLKDADILADKLLERLKINDWSESYLKICSGNGVQLIIKLDYSIQVVNTNFNADTQEFDFNEEFETQKDLIRNGIGKKILEYSKIYCKNENLKVDVDASGFNMGRVGALPCTKNFKYNSFTWRGIIDMKDKPNIGLTDYLYSFKENIKSFKSKNVFDKSSIIKRENFLTEKNFNDHKFIKLLYDIDFSFVGVNNRLWMQLKILLRDSKFNLNSEVFKKFHREMERKKGNPLTMNVPDKRFTWNETAINNFCIDYLIPPIYDIFPTRNYKCNLYRKIDWDKLNQYDSLTLDLNTSIKEDIKSILPEIEKTLKLKEIDGKNLKNYTFEYINELKENKIKELISKFINGCILKYGEKKTKYYYEYCLERMFNFQ